MKRKTDGKEAIIIELYRNGASALKIGELLNISDSTIHAFLRRNNVPPHFPTISESAKKMQKDRKNAKQTAEKPVEMQQAELKIETNTSHIDVRSRKRDLLFKLFADMLDVLEV